MRITWVSLTPGGLILLLLAGVSAPVNTYYIYGVSLALLISGIYLKKAAPIYFSGIISFLALIPVAMVRDDWILTLGYSFLVLLSIEVALETLPQGYLTTPWKHPSMQRFLITGHIAFLGVVLGVSILLVQLFLFLQLRTNDILFLLIITVLIMGGLTFLIRICAKGTPS